MVQCLHSGREKCGALDVRAAGLLGEVPHAEVALIGTVLPTLRVPPLPPLSLSVTLGLGSTEGLLGGTAVAEGPLAGAVAGMELDGLHQLSFRVRPLRWAIRI